MTTRPEDIRKSSKNLIGEIIGDFRVDERIGEGGFGHTYKGTELVIDRPVCIKHCPYISRDYRDTLIKETQALWDLRHFAIPSARKLYNLDDGSMALVMSYIPGLTLDKIIKRSGPLNDAYFLDKREDYRRSEHVAWIAERSLNVLNYLHDHGVVHCDFKPQNIILQHQQHMLILVDYGISAVRPTTASRSSGYTPYFAAPEQMSEKSLVVPESDYYSLGMTMLYMLGGGLDYVKRKYIPANIPKPLADFIGRLIVRDVRNRPQYKKENLWETIQQVRIDSFGQARSGMRPIPGLDD